MKFRFSALAAVLALALLAGKARAQTAYPDLLVLANGDSVRCAFISTEGESVGFFFKNEFGEPAKSRENKKGLRYFDKGYYARREAGPGNPVRVLPLDDYRKEAKAVQEQQELEEPDEAVIRIEGGYGYRFAKTDGDSYWLAGVKDYEKDLRDGGLIGLYLGTIKRKHFGGGVRVEQYWASGNWKERSLKTKMSTLFIGAEVEFRLPFKRAGGSHLYSSLGTGFAFYREENKSPTQNYTLDYLGVPLRAGLGIHLKVAPHFAFIAGTHAVLGAASRKPFQTDGVSISRIGATGGLAFTF